MHLCLGLHESLNKSLLRLSRLCLHARPRLTRACVQTRVGLDRLQTGFGSAGAASTAQRETVRCSLRRHKLPKLSCARRTTTTASAHSKAYASESALPVRRRWGG